jgi:hypothetical protein
MKTAAIKIKTYAKGVNSVVTDNVSMRKNILRGIFAAAGVLAVCYVVILGSMVFNIVERKALEANARTIANDVSELELQYLNMSKSIDLSLATSKGFKETDTKKFATRKALGSISFAKNDL